MRIFTFYISVTLFAVITANASANPVCRVPSGAEQNPGNEDTGHYNFSYVSYLWDNPKSDFDFGRCVANKKARPLWVDWKKLGLKGTVKGKDHAKKIVPSQNDNKEVKASKLYYGSGPSLTKPDAIYRSSEADAAGPLDGFIWKAANHVEIDLEKALQSSEEMWNQSAFLKKEFPKSEGRFRVTGFARIALPINKDAFELMRSGDGKPDDLNNKFYNIMVTVGQSFEPTGGSISVRPVLVFRVDPRDAWIFDGAETLKVSFEGSSGPLVSQIEPLGSSLEISQPYTDVMEKVPPKNISYPAIRTTSRIVMTFGDFGGLDFEIPTIEF